MQTLQVSFANRSGHVLRGIVTLPEGEGPRPFVVHLHGFGGSLSGHKYMYTNMARALAREGIGCARFDFFGCGESDGEFGETTLTGFHHDAEDMCAWAIEQGYADAAHLVLSRAWAATWPPPWRLPWLLPPSCCSARARPCGTAPPSVRTW